MSGPRFSHHNALITGAASGIGRATALAFAAEGAKVIVSDIDDTGGQETVRLIRKANGEALYIRCDVSQKTDIKALFAAAIETFGHLDIAVNNAGTGGNFIPFAHYSDEAWEKVIAINQTGVFQCMKEELRHMQERHRGAIVNVASVAGMKALPNAAAYVASKHAVLGLTKVAAVEYARFNVRVNAVCPVFTRTPMFEQMFQVDPSLENKLLKNIPVHRYGEPEDIANAILWLCDPNSSFVTGLCLPVDGGMTA